jgi:hypothetical protein
MDKRRRVIRRAVSIVMLAVALGFGAAQSAGSQRIQTGGSDPLPSWNDDAAKRGIIDFVTRVTVEEEQEAHLENVTVKLTGADAPRVTVTRLDNSTATPTEMITTITRVRRISPQFDVDNSEDGMEIEDEDGVLAVLRLESEVDGAS